MKAQTEAQALLHMAEQFRTGNGLLSGSNEAWVQAKVRALQVMDQHAQRIHGRPIQSLVDIGIGDMRHLEAWERFQDVYYVGVDGCPQVIAAARERHPEEGRLFLEMPFSQLLGKDRRLLTVLPPDAILLLDVLYHIPEEVVEQELLTYVYTSPAQYIVLSHATDPGQLFNGASGIGQPGFCWFPRRWTRPDGWDVIHQEYSTGAPQKQRLLVLTRSV